MISVFWKRNKRVIPPPEDASNPMDNVAPTAVWLHYPGAFPGYAGKETVHLEANRHRGSWWHEADPGVPTDPSIGGMPADVDILPYSTGIVEPNIVEDFSLMGGVNQYRRPPESNPGPVSSLDYRSQLAMQIIQSMTPDVYDEASQLSVIGGF